MVGVRRAGLTIYIDAGTIYASGVGLRGYLIGSCVRHDFGSLNKFRIKYYALHSSEANTDPRFVHGELRLSHLLRAGPFLVPLEGGTVSGPPNPMTCSGRGLRHSAFVLCGMEMINAALLIFRRVHLVVPLVGRAP
jgi:hypothetical protein